MLIQYKVVVIDGKIIYCVTNITKDFQTKSRILPIYGKRRNLLLSKQYTSQLQLLTTAIEKEKKKVTISTILFPILSTYTSNKNKPKQLKNKSDTLTIILYIYCEKKVFKLKPASITL